MNKMEKLNQDIAKLTESEVILDVRSKEEFNEGHVPGALNIPHDEVQNHLEELKKYSTIFVHCQKGGRAKLASETLDNLGLKNIACIDDSGMQHWIESSFPVEK